MLSDLASRLMNDIVLWRQPTKCSVFYAFSKSCATPWSSMVAPKLFICPSAAFNRGPGSAFVCLSTSLQPFFLVFLFCCLKRPLSDNSMFVFVHSFLWYFLVCRNDVGLGCVQGYVWLTRSFSFLPSEFHIAGQALPQLRWMPWPLQVRSHQNVGRQATLPSGKEMCGVPGVALTQSYCYMTPMFFP